MMWMDSVLILMGILDFNLMNEISEECKKVNLIL